MTTKFAASRLLTIRAKRVAYGKGVSGDNPF
jgi:hypothetical protein